MPLSRELALALEAADLADRIAASRFRAEDLVVDVKPNGSPTSDADRAIEAAVVDLFRSATPGRAILGCEGDTTSDAGAASWVIDPIDGSAAFIAGEPGWGFTACLVVDGEPVVGVASSVGLGKRWWAVREGGAFARPLSEPDARLPLRVSTRGSIAEARVGWWDGYRTTAHGRASSLDPTVALLRERAQSVVATGAAAIEVATGALDAAVMRSPDGGPWHSALFVLLVREAGGRTIEWNGRERIVFSNPWIHDELVALLDGDAGEGR